MDFFLEISDEEIRRERDKARTLRKSNWWKNRIAQGVCHYCGARVRSADLSLDHIVPLARGGKSTRGNCVASCKECNNRKKDLLPMEWEAYLTGLQQKKEADGHTG